MASSKAQLIELADNIAMKLETDSGFRDAVKADPKAALLAAGLPETVIENSLIRPGIVLAGGCTDLTCFSSACPGTCSVTVVNSTTCHCGV